MAENNQTERLVSGGKETTLTSTEAQVLRLADRGELSCPRCGQKLWGNGVVAEGIYAGVVLVCLADCGFREN